MFIEVTDSEYNKKHFINISSIVDIVDNNKEGFYPHTLIVYSEGSMAVKESYKHIKESIENIVNLLSKGNKK